ncbi:hypothetical protein BGX26_009344 [Mortierella sp. AD094]|nr:hypothetical protein BGX26_009344 [Mortierella sp. AD094]
MPPSTTSASVSTEGKFQNEPNVFAKRAPRQKTPDLTNLIRFIQKNSTLRKLSLYGGMFWQQKLSSISRLFKAIPETVEDLDIAARYGQPPKESEELTAELNEDDNEGAQLNINQIKFQHTMLDERVLVPLLKRCPRLKTIVLNVHLSRSLSQEFFSVLRGHCPQLKELRVMKNLGRFCSDSDISYLLGSTTNGWKSIYLTFLPTFGSLSEAALLKNAPSLEVLQTATCPRFTSPLIQKILCTAPNLIRLDLLDRLHSPNPLGLKAQDIIQSKWVCDKLEVLRVRITGIPRPDLRIHYNNPPLKKPIHEGQIEDSFLIQRKVYSQLGAMIHLKELILGLVYDGDFQSRESERYWTDRGWRQNECLSFTLRSGMGQLQHLKSLERIHLHGMTVGFNGAAEQLWVKDNWPALKYMYGDWNKYDRTLWERDVYFNGLK